MASQPITATAGLTAPAASNPIPPSFKFKGMSGRFKLLPGENPELFNATVNFFFTTFRPSNLDGCLAAVNASMASWLLRRADSQETALRDLYPIACRAAEAVLHIERTRSVPRRTLCRALAALGHKFEEPASGGISAPTDPRLQELLALARKSKRGRPAR